MKSNKKRGTAIKSRRNPRAVKRLSGNKEPRRDPRSFLTAPVNEALLAPYQSYGVPKLSSGDFTLRFLFVAQAAVRRKFGRRHSKSGGTKR